MMRYDACRFSVAFQQSYKFTGKERDSESGLDLMGRRYYGSAMGRFMTPDPLIIQKQKLLDPQQWNMYGYARNNPLRYIDPTGLYVVNCASGDKACNKNADAFEKARQQDLKSKNADVRNAASAYGDRGKDNGVTVGFGDPGAGKNGTTTVGLRQDPNNPNAFQATANVTIRPGQSSTGLEATVGHEGVHIEDAQGFAATVTASGHYDLSRNLTQYQTELNAYRVTQAIQSSANESASYGQCGSGQCVFGPGVRNIDDVINQLLADPRNGYGLTPANPGQRQFPDITTPNP